MDDGDERGKKEADNDKKEADKGESSSTGASASELADELGAMKLAAPVIIKPRIPFHVPTIPKPQDVYNYYLNNSNQPFQHIWLGTSEDGMRYVHPLEKYVVSTFVDRKIGAPIKPLSLEETPFKLVEEVRDLRELAAKLSHVDEFAVDLEHNHYRSFQGLTCLMQISTRKEDYIVDTLKLRMYIGPHLREVFKSPLKKKVMHGADKDILWLQRDFGIYVCNLFDTGQASKILKLEKNSLEFLLQYFCGVTANKEYQTSDWRIRPLPDEMVRYAREDTHYLLYIYDLMKIQLHSMPRETVYSHSRLFEVYKNSADVCLKLYEKEIHTDNSYLKIYGLNDAGFNGPQLSVVAGLCRWRDCIARDEDESTGYVLPNRTLLEIAKEIPLSVRDLLHLLKHPHPYVERDPGSVVGIIRYSMLNAGAYDDMARFLKAGHIPYVSEEQLEAVDGPSALAAVNMEGVNSETESTTLGSAANHCILPTSADLGSVTQKISFALPHANGKLRVDSEPYTSVVLGGSFSSTRHSSQQTPASKGLSASAKAFTVVHVSKKPSFGAVLGNAAANNSFVGLMENEEKGDPRKNEPAALPASSSKLDTTKTPENDPNIKELEICNSETLDTPNGNESDGDDEYMSLSELATGFQKCFEDSKENRKAVKAVKSQEPNGCLQLKPFTRNQVRLEETYGVETIGDHQSFNSVGVRNVSAGEVQKNDQTKEFSQGR